MSEKILTNEEAQQAMEAKKAAARVEGALLDLVADTLKAVARGEEQGVERFLAAVLACEMTPLMDLPGKVWRFADWLRERHDVPD